MSVPTPSERGTQVGLPPSRSKISFTREDPVVGACTNGRTCLTKSVQSPPAPDRKYARPAAVIGRRSSPVSTLPQLERVGHNRVHLVAVAQRTACIGYDEISFAQPIANLDVHVRMKSDLNHPSLDDVVAHDLDSRSLGSVVHRSFRNCGQHRLWRGRTFQGVTRDLAPTKDAPCQVACVDQQRPVLGERDPKAPDCLRSARARFVREKSLLRVCSELRLQAQSRCRPRSGTTAQFASESLWLLQRRCCASRPPQQELSKSWGCVRQRRHLVPRRPAGPAERGSGQMSPGLPRRPALRSPEARERRA